MSDLDGMGHPTPVGMDNVVEHELNPAGGLNLTGGVEADGEPMDFDRSGD